MPTSEQKFSRAPKSFDLSDDAEEGRAEPLLRKQYYISQAQVDKLEWLQREYRFASAADALRHAIDAYDPASDPRVQEAFSDALEAMNNRIDEASATIETLRGTLDRHLDPQRRNEEAEAIREQTRRYYEAHPGEFDTVATALFGANEERV